MASDNDNVLAALVHVSGLFVSFFGPLIFYLVIKDKVVKENSRKALNFQITVTIASIIILAISIPLMLILIGFLTMFLGLLVLGVVNLIFSVIAAIKAVNGENWDYPLSINLIK